MLRAQRHGMLFCTVCIPHTLILCVWSPGLPSENRFIVDHIRFSQPNVLSQIRERLIVPYVLLPIPKYANGDEFKVPPIQIYQLF